MATSPLALDRRTMLSRISIFSELSDGDLDKLVEYTTTKHIKARQEVFHKGDSGGECYAILAGRCKATSRSSEGKEVTFAVMDPGEVFGEMAMLLDQERTATVTALEDCDLLMVSRRDLVPLLERESRMALKVLSAVTRRLSRLTQMMEDTIFRNLPSRLARKLLVLCDAYGSEEGDHILIGMKLSQGELGAMVGTTRESVNKQIKNWEREGIVTHGDGDLRVLDRGALETLAEFV